MAQRSYKDDGTGNFRFFAGADDAIKTYLTTKAGNLSTFLVTGMGTTFAAHRYETEPTQEGGKFPLVYIATVGFTDTPEETRTAHPSPTTHIRVWVRHAEYDTAAANCMAITGAICSALRQTHFVADGGDWRDFYCNIHPVELATAELTINPNDQEPWQAEQLITLTWAHYETL